MTTPPMLRQMRHDVWATGMLLDHCRSLTQEQLQLTRRERTARSRRRSRTSFARTRATSTHMG